jgi:gliding motility-associated-like protein
VRYFLIALFSLLPFVSMAQLTAPGMKTVRYTAYPSAPGVKDPIFIFCNSTGTQKGALHAVSPGGTGPFKFSWYKWSDATKSFSMILKTDLAKFFSDSTNLDEGGYKIKITNDGGYADSLVCWIFLDKPFAQAKLQNFTCDYVALSGKAAIDPFYYKNPATGDSVKLPNVYSFTWSSNPISFIPYPSLEINPVTFTPPLEDVTYKIQVTDSFLCNSESSFQYISIHVKADFTFDPAKGEAPLEVKFTDKSIHGSTYLWEFGDHSTDSISLIKNPEPHIYYRPGEYTVKLTVTSDQLCVDSLRSPAKVVVDPSELKIPNVFTPDGDGINDYFIVESKSLQSISVEIFSKSGRRVYNFSGDGTRLKDWLGWDGTVNHSSAKATPGVYFYIIRARGWDDKVYDSQEYRGFLYLYR